jgi:hypothetical protein
MYAGEAISWCSRIRDAGSRAVRDAHLLTRRAANRELRGPRRGLCSRPPSPGWIGRCHHAVGDRVLGVAERSLPLAGSGDATPCLSCRDTGELIANDRLLDLEGEPGVPLLSRHGRAGRRGGKFPVCPGCHGVPSGTDAGTADRRGQCARPPAERPSRLPGSYCKTAVTCSVSGANLAIWPRTNCEASPWSMIQRAPSGSATMPIGYRRSDTALSGENPPATVNVIA